MSVARRPSWIAWGAMAATVIVALWMATPFVVRQIYPQDVATRGQFGDIFGSVNALYSGLALAGVTGELIGHVEFTNVGHLPASQVRWHVEMTASNDPDWAPPVPQPERFGRTSYRSEN